MAARVVKVERDSGGLFGIRNSPSMAGALPDPRVITATALGSDSGPLRVRVPGGELSEEVVVGNRVVVGLVDEAHVICILTPPPSLPDEGLTAWAKTQKCG